MLHAKSQGHWPSGSVEDFKGVLTPVHLGLEAILIMGLEQFV